MIRGYKMTMLAALLVAAGCGGSVTAGGGAATKLDKSVDSGKKDKTGQAVSKVAAASFEAALAEFQGHDRKQDWNETSCNAMADSFMGASKQQKSAAGRDLPEALYNAGISYQRCGKDDAARTKFEETVRADASMHRAKAQLALYDYAKSGNLDQAISQLDQIIRDAKFQNTEGLVALAALQMERQSDQPDQDGKNDFERAQRNLQRALAIDDSFMPAFNQLSIYYLEQARAKAGQESSRTKGKRRRLVVSGAKRAELNEQQLDLAALVASQAQKKNPNYAPIHNTTGLILVELGNYNGAVKAFAKARAADPKFFEAHMNYAAVNLSFRGFEEAEKAYRQAIGLRPKEYEAHLGLALAIRGQINVANANFDKQVADVEKELAAAKQIDGQRPEAYFNEAILTQEYKAKRGNAVPTLEKAAKQYDDFIAKAGGDAAFADAVKRSKERTQDIRDTVKFIKEGEEAAKHPPPKTPMPKEAGEEGGGGAPPAKGAAPPAKGAAPPAKGAPPKK